MRDGWTVEGGFCIQGSKGLPVGFTSPEIAISYEMNSRLARESCAMKNKTQLSTG